MRSIFAYDRDGVLIESPDLTLGKIELVEIAAEARLIIKKEEVGHWETIAEYPETGGKTVEWVVDEEGVREWKLFSGKEELDVPFVHDGRDSVLSKQVYIPFTQEELDARNHKPAETQQAEPSEGAPLSIEQRVMQYQAEQDAAICELYEMMLEVTNASSN